MFGKKKSMPEKIIGFIGDKLDGNVMKIAKTAGGTLTSLAVAAVGASAVINAVRDDDES